jgi:biotin operon repressor
VIWQPQQLRELQERGNKVRQKKKKGHNLAAAAAAATRSFSLID